MLGGRISNHDEDEIELELDALEAEARRAEPLPKVPVTQLPSGNIVEPPQAQMKQEEPEREAMLA